MRRLSDRHFNLEDAMVLVAATAAGMAWVHAYYDPQSFAIAWRFYVREGYWTQATQYLIRAAWPFVLAWTMAILILRLRPPRPPRRWLARQPGLVACCAVTLAAATLLWPTLVGLIAGIPAPDSVSGPARFWRDIASGDGSAETIGLAVVAAWLTLALGGRWRPESSWVDRAGRALGIVWIGLLLVSSVIHVVFIVREYL
jgi:hypothetical protein